jgi:MiaB/RimO family radical SAM methylthiotransferase
MEYRIFGCKTNKYFTDKWLSSPDFSSKPGIFVASCVVTENAKRKWKRFVKKAAADLPEGGKIYLSGCGSLTEGKVSDRFYEEYPDLAPLRDKIELLAEDPDDVDGGFRWGHSHVGMNKHAEAVENRKKSPSERVLSLKAALSKSNLFTRKYSVVQTGCDNLCTFCLTVAARGAHKWRTADEIVDEIDEFALGGGAETVLTGTNVGAWGSTDSNDFENGRLYELIETLWNETDIRRVRVSSLGPEFLSPEMLATFTKPRSHAYVHLSIQSGSDSVLKKMRRKYGRDFLRAKLSEIRSLVREDGAKINIGADLIVGFPGETEADFEDTLSLVRDFGITQVHAFPFSPHEGLHAVPASKLPDQIPDSIKSKRMERLVTEAEFVREAFLAKHDGLELELLPEGSPTREKFSGWSENHIALNEKNFIPHGTVELKK